MTFLELANKVLETSDSPLSATEIWKRVLKQGLDSELNSQGKTPWASISAQLYVNIRDKKNSIFKTIGERPKLFYLKKKENIILENIKENKTIHNSEEDKKNNSYLEKDLHTKLVQFAYNNFLCSCKTINHSTSKKSSFNKWIHPDIVGCRFYFKDWNKSISNLNKLTHSSSIKLFSFELKKELTFNNLRESFFQTFSNSSWANEGYLVANEIEKEQEFIEELERLNSAFGIGIIELDFDNPLNSQVVYPARTKENLDWNTMDKLMINKDFKNFVDSISNSSKIDKILENEFDKIV